MFELAPLQMGPGPIPSAPVNPFEAVVGSAVGAFLSTLVVGGLVVGFAPGYAERVTTRMRERLGNSFAYGLFVFLAAFLVLFLLVITVIGIPAAFLLGVLLAVGLAIGTALGYLAVGLQVVGRDEGWLRPLLVGAGLAAVLTLIPVVGGIVSFCVSCVGFGAVFADWAE